MAVKPRREGRRKSKFQRAADGSMTLMEHLQDLRTRLVIAILVILVGTAVAMVFSKSVIEFLAQPYCSASGAPIEDGEQALCNFTLNSPVSHIGLYLKVSLYMALVATSPIWLYQLWAFIAPGLHRNERKYAYMFIGIAAPLFLAGAVLAYFVVSHGLEFIMLLQQDTGLQIALNLENYINFYLAVMLVFGLGFEFPLIMLMLNVMGIVTARKMLSWWRIVVFVSFLFTAIFTPTPDPFGMTALAICMLILYMGAVGIATINDKRRGIHDEPEWSDDEAGDIGEADGVGAADPVGSSEVDEDDEDPVRRNRLGRRVDGYDDIT
ncbi:twin-arginine translocase subunit TatC [Glycomyces sp. L485]|uniref:twin-arginine translocase subunit TatC n=1 Tax=Glycomyces sp. L485 TaxID=2909235 RepID=UPI001F4AACEB|nr:twin-arginine translocase subunit TatC [Glycomyces sp. L485]MCH7231536.1 twin-arginine translocase subunit TatC [Glycomyces sp. L485]